MTAAERTERMRRFASSEELHIVLQGIADGITVQDATGQIVYANLAAARSIGLPDVATLLAMPFDQMLARFEITDEAGLPIGADRLPGHLVFAGIESAITVRVRIVATGEVRWSEIQARPVFDPEGRVELAINIWHDITERRRREDSARFLAEASSLLAGSFDLPATLAALGRLALSILGSACAIHLSFPTGGLRRVAAASVNRAAVLPEAHAEQAKVLAVGEPIAQPRASGRARARARTRPRHHDLRR